MHRSQEEEEKEREEAERRKREEAERLAKLEEVARKQREKEAEIEEKKRREREALLAARPPAPAEPPAAATPAAPSSGSAFVPSALGAARGVLLIHHGVIISGLRLTLFPRRYPCTDFWPRCPILRV